MPKRAERQGTPPQERTFPSQTSQKSFGSKRITKIAAAALVLSVAAVVSLVALYFTYPALLAPAGGLYLCVIPGTTGAIALFILIVIPLAKRVSQMLNKRSHQAEQIVSNDVIEGAQNEAARITTTGKRPPKRTKKPRRRPKPKGKIEILTDLNQRAKQSALNTSDNDLEVSDVSKQVASDTLSDSRSSVKKSTHLSNISAPSSSDASDEHLASSIQTIRRGRSHSFAESKKTQIRGNRYKSDGEEPKDTRALVKKDAILPPVTALNSESFDESSVTKIDKQIASQDISNLPVARAAALKNQKKGPKRFEIDLPEIPECKLPKPFDGRDTEKVEISSDVLKALDAADACMQPVVIGPSDLNLPEMNATLNHLEQDQRRLQNDIQGPSSEEDPPPIIHAVPRKALAQCKGKGKLSDDDEERVESSGDEVEEVVIPLNAKVDVKKAVNQTIIPLLQKIGALAIAILRATHYAEVEKEIIKAKEHNKQKSMFRSARSIPKTAIDALRKKEKGVKDDKKLEQPLLKVVGAVENLWSTLWREFDPIEVSSNSKVERLIDLDLDDVTLADLHLRNVLQKYNGKPNLIARNVYKALKPLNKIGIGGGIKKPECSDTVGQSFLSPLLQECRAAEARLHKGKRHSSIFKPSVRAVDFNLFIDFANMLSKGKNTVYFKTATQLLLEECIRDKKDIALLLKVITHLDIENLTAVALEYHIVNDLKVLLALLGSFLHPYTQKSPSFPLIDVGEQISKSLIAALGDGWRAKVVAAGISALNPKQCLGLILNQKDSARWIIEGFQSIFFEGKPRKKYDPLKSKCIDPEYFIQTAIGFMRTLMIDDHETCIKEEISERKRLEKMESSPIYQLQCKVVELKVLQKAQEFWLSKGQRPVISDFEDCNAYAEKKVLECEQKLINGEVLEEEDLKGESGLKWIVEQRKKMLKGEVEPDDKRKFLNAIGRVRDRLTCQLAAQRRRKIFQSLDDAGKQALLQAVIKKYPRIQQQAFDEASATFKDLEDETFCGAKEREALTRLLEKQTMEKLEDIVVQMLDDKKWDYPAFENYMKKMQNGSMPQRGRAGGRFFLKQLKPKEREVLIKELLQSDPSLIQEIKDSASVLIRSLDHDEKYCKWLSKQTRQVKTACKKKKNETPTGIRAQAEAAFCKEAASWKPKFDEILAPFVEALLPLLFPLLLSDDAAVLNVIFNDVLLSNPNQPKHIDQVFTLINQLGDQSEASRDDVIKATVGVLTHLTEALSDKFPLPQETQYELNMDIPKQTSSSGSQRKQVRK